MGQSLQKPPPKPWNDWSHVPIHVYGSWLRGDPRGWRARHHREHVEGDYKNPPPPKAFENEYRDSVASMTRPRVRIESDLRKFVLDAVVGKLTSDGIEVLIACVDASHLHLLARFTDGDPKHWIGRAKKHSSH